MGKQDIIQVLTPDHQIEATFLDEDGTVGELLSALAEDNDQYSQGWALVEVLMPRTKTLTYHELFALDQGVLSPETRIRAVQDRYSTTTTPGTTTVFKLVNTQLTLPVIFRHVPNVPEHHYRQLHVLATMTVRQVLDVVVAEMALLKATAGSSGAASTTATTTNGSPGSTGNNSKASSDQQRAPTEYVMMQVKVGEDGIEDERQLADDEKPYDLLLENRRLLVNHEIKDYHFVLTVPDSWVAKVESVTSRISKGWSATRPLSMAVYGLFGGGSGGANELDTGSNNTSPTHSISSPVAISAPIPIASTSIHHPSYQDQSGGNAAATSAAAAAARKRQSMIAGPPSSRLSSFFDPSALSSWLAPSSENTGAGGAAGAGAKNKRHSIVFGQSNIAVNNTKGGGGLMSGSMSSNSGFKDTYGPPLGIEVAKLSDQELSEAFETLLNDLNIKEGLRESMMSFPREKKVALIEQNQQMQQHKEQQQQQQQQQQRVSSPEPPNSNEYNNAPTGSNRDSMSFAGLLAAGFSGSSANLGGPRANNNRGKNSGSMSSRVSFIEPDNNSGGGGILSGIMPAKLHSRYSSWTSLSGSFEAGAEDGNSGTDAPGSPGSTYASSIHERPLSPTTNNNNSGTTAASTPANSLWSSWFGGGGSSAANKNADQSQDGIQDDSPQFYIDQLMMNRNTSPKILAKHLQGLRITLATAKLSWTIQFLEGGRGFRALEYVLDKTTVKRKGQGKGSDLDETLQSECVQCLRVLMNTEPGFAQVLKSPSLVAHISYCLYTTNNKLRTKVAEVLAALCVMSPESHRLVLVALSDFRVAHEERFRFEYLVETLAAPITSGLDMDANSTLSGNPNLTNNGGHMMGYLAPDNFEWEYKTACLSLMNALANSPVDLDERIQLRDELRRRGLEDVFRTLQNQSPPESLLIQINVYEEERHEDWVDLQERDFERLHAKRLNAAAAMMAANGGSTTAGGGLNGGLEGLDTTALLYHPGGVLTDLEKEDNVKEMVQTVQGWNTHHKLYPKMAQILLQYSLAAKATLEEDDADSSVSEEEDGTSEDGSKTRTVYDPLTSQSEQFKQDLWTIVEKFGDQVFKMRGDLADDWAGAQDVFLESIQHIVGKRGIVLSFNGAIDYHQRHHNQHDGNGLVASSAASQHTTHSGASVASSRRHSYIDFEVDNLRRDLDDVRDEAALAQRELAKVSNENFELIKQVQKVQDLAKQYEQRLQELSSPPPTSNAGSGARHSKQSSSSSVVLGGLWNHHNNSSKDVSSTTSESGTSGERSAESTSTFIRRENHAGVVQRLVQKEREVALLRETIERMEKKYKDKAEVVNLETQLQGSEQQDSRKSERAKELDSTRWNAIMNEVQTQKSKTAEVTSLADDRQKEIDYLKRALQIVCTRYENAVGERVPAVTEDDHQQQQQQSSTGAPVATGVSLQLSKTFEALARKDEEVAELKEQVDRLKRQAVSGMTPTEENLFLRTSLKELMQKVQEYQSMAEDRENVVKGLKEQVILLEAAKKEDNYAGVTQPNEVGSPSFAQSSSSTSGSSGGGRVDRSHSQRGTLKLQIKALSAKGWQAAEVDEGDEHEIGGMVGTGGDLEAAALAAQQQRQQRRAMSPERATSRSPRMRHSKSPTPPSISTAMQQQMPPMSPQLGAQATRPLTVGGNSKRPALPPPPPPPGPRHRLTADGSSQLLQTQGPPPPPPSQAVKNQSGTVMQPPPPPPPAQQVRSPQSINEVTAPLAPVGGPPAPPPPPPMPSSSLPASNFSQQLLNVKLKKQPAPVEKKPVFVAEGESESSGELQRSDSQQIEALTVGESSAAGKLATPPMLPPKASAGPPPPPPPPFTANVAAGGGLQRSASMPAQRSASGPPPPPPPPPGMGGNGIPQAPPAPRVGGPPNAPLPPPPPPPPPGGLGITQHGYEMSTSSVATTLTTASTMSMMPLLPPVPVAKNAAKASRPMKQLFWNKVPNGTITLTVWKDICDPQSSVEVIDLDYSELDLLFCKNFAAATSTASSADAGLLMGLDKKGQQQRTVISLLNVNRANNIAIMLSRIKLSYREIRLAIMEMVDSKLTIENLKAIKQYVPQGDEIELIKEFEGNFEQLGNAERFYREVMDIPRLSERLVAMIYRRRLEIEVSELEPEIEVLRRTIDELKKSEQLKSLLKTVLVMGNHLNGNSFRGNAYGFTLDALLKIRDTKGIEGFQATVAGLSGIGGQSLLHYLAKSISGSKDPSMIRFLEKEVPHLEAAARVSVQQILNVANGLVVGMKQIREEIRVLKRIRLISNDYFVERMTTFVEENEKGVEVMYEVVMGLEQDLKDLLIFYGEDPLVVKPEEFFNLIVTFSSMLQKADAENRAQLKKLEAAKAKAKKNPPIMPLGGYKAGGGGIRRPSVMSTLQEQLDKDERESNGGSGRSTVASTITAVIGEENKTGAPLTMAGIRDGIQLQQQQQQQHNNMDEAIRGLRSGLRRDRKARPMSHLYSELSMEALTAMNSSPGGVAAGGNSGGVGGMPSRN